jgi:hypothetical protein
MKAMLSDIQECWAFKMPVKQRGGKTYVLTNTSPYGGRRWVLLSDNSRIKHWTGSRPVIIIGD